jgi:hypothetical protein
MAGVQMDELGMTPRGVRGNRAVKFASVIQRPPLLVNIYLTIYLESLHIIEARISKPSLACVTCHGSGPVTHCFLRISRAFQVFIAAL